MKKSSSDLHQVRPRREGILEIRALIHLVSALISGMSLPLGLTLQENTPTFAVTEAIYSKYQNLQKQNSAQDGYLGLCCRFKLEFIVHL